MKYKASNQINRKKSCLSTIFNKFVANFSPPSASRKKIKSLKWERDWRNYEIMIFMQITTGNLLK